MKILTNPGLASSGFEPSSSELLEFLLESTELANMKPLPYLLCGFLARREIHRRFWFLLLDSDWWW